MRLEQERGQWLLEKTQLTNRLGDTSTEVNAFTLTILTRREVGTFLNEIN